MSYQIKSNLPVSGSHWGLVFRDGVAVTENRSLAERLKERGYEVSEMIGNAVIVDAPVKVQSVIVEVPTNVPEPKFVECANEPEPEPAMFTCPKCGKEYKNETSFNKHVAKCEG